MTPSHPTARRLGSLIAALAATVPLSGQIRISGMAATHSTIQAAIDAAADGATLLVTPGTYPSFTILRKGIRIVPAGIGSIRIAALDGKQGVRIRELSPDHDVFLQGLDVVWSSATTPAIEMLGCWGPIVLDQCRVSVAPELAASRPTAPIAAPIDARGVLQLRLSVVAVRPQQPASSSFSVPGVPTDDGLAAVLLWGCNALFDRCNLHGFDNPDVHGAAGGPAIRAYPDTRIEFVGGIDGDEIGIVGGDGGRIGGAAVHAMLAGTVTVSAASITNFLPGNGAEGDGGIYAIGDDRGRIVTAGTSRLRHIPDSLGDDYSHALVYRQPDLTGEPFLMAVEGRPGRSCVVLASPHPALVPFAVPGFRGWLGVAPKTAVPILNGALPIPAQPLSFLDDPRLSGLLVAVQPVLAPGGGSTGWAFGIGDVFVVR